MGISEDYDASFFLMHTGWTEEYNVVADSLNKHLQFKNALDLGCGNGYLLQRLAQRGKRIMGIDGSTYAKSYLTTVLIMDLTKDVRVDKHELVICTEVAEHLPASAADTLVDNICWNAVGLVFFSAAVPGFGGHLHLNEQQPEYWLEKFAKHHFVRNERLTNLIQTDLAPLKMIWWFKNAYVLKRM